MADFFRKYWIAGLVLLLVLIHGSIIGYIRSEASKLQVAASREFSLGDFTVLSPDRSYYTKLKVHAMLPSNRRIQGRNTLQQNFWQLHESVEQHLRTAEPELLKDPVLTEIKETLQRVTTERIGEELIEEILITDLLEVPVEGMNSFGPPANSSDHHSSNSHTFTSQKAGSGDHASPGAHDNSGSHSKPTSPAASKEHSSPTSHAKPKATGASKSKDSHDSSSHDSGSHASGSHDSGHGGH